MFRMQCIQNIGLTIAPVIAGIVVDKFGFFSLQIYASVITASNLWEN